MIGAAPRARRAQHRDGLRAGLGARRPPRDVRAALATTPSSARRRQRLQRTYAQAAETLTLERVRAGAVTDDTTSRSTLETRIFGTLKGTLTLPTGEREDAGPGVDWRAELVYPGLRRGREAQARDDAPAARHDPGPRRHRARQGPGPPVRSRTARVRDRRPVGPAPEQRAAELEARGVPTGAPVGLTGLEREFDERLSGTPGGMLYAGDRVLARKPKAGQRGAHDDRPEAPARRDRGARRPLRRDRGRRARATARCSRWPGSRQSAPQPPGTTFKIVTLAGVLENKVAKRTVDLPGPDRGHDRGRRDPERQRRVLRRLAAQSPSRTPATASSRRWAPSSAREKLVDDRREVRLQPGPGPRRRGALHDPRRGRDRRRPRGRLVRDRPGQGARHAAADGARRRATIGADGVRPQPDAAQGRRPAARARDQRRRSPARSRATCARVVTDGTGGAAALPGVKVSGKTGTAELRTTVKEEPPPEVTDPNAAAARGRHHRHRRLVRRLRALQQAEDRRRGAARRPGHGRRHRRARGAASSSRPR